MCCGRPHSVTWGGGGGVACDSSNQHEGVHRCHRLRMLGGMCMDCVCLPEISSVANGFTGAPDSGVLSDCCLSSLAVNLSDCTKVIPCFVVPA